MFSCVGRKATVNSAASRRLATQLQNQGASLTHEKKDNSGAVLIGMGLLAAAQGSNPPQHRPLYHMLHRLRGKPVAREDRM
jgi:hypothetical protein